MGRPWLPYVCVFLVAFAVSLATTPLAGRLARRVGAVDYPGGRRVNERVTPRMGGIAVFAAVVAAFVAQYLGTTLLGWETVLSPSEHLIGIDYHVLVASFAVIFAVGLADDRYHLRASVKLAGQTAAASVAVAGGLVIGSVTDPLADGTLVSLGWAAYPLTVLYLVGYANVFNLIDGLDGLASGIAAIAGLTMFVTSFMAGRPDAATLAISLVGAAIGFLRYNFHPASIFLGDSGSLLIGFTLGVVSLLSVTRVAGITTVILPLVVAGMPILDTAFAMLRRARAGVSIGHADRGHIHHRLLDAGLGQGRAAVVMYAWTGALCVGTIVMTQVGVWARIGIFVGLLAASVAFALRLRLFEPVLLHHTDERTGEDELVAPGTPEFDCEHERFVEEHHLERAGDAVRGR